MVCEGSAREMRLKHRIDKLLEKSETDNEAFLPAGSLEPYLTKDALAQESGDFIQPDDPLADFILSRAVKVFLITSTVPFDSGRADIHRAMEIFHENNFGDDELPTDQFLANAPHDGSAHRSSATRDIGNGVQRRRHLSQLAPDGDLWSEANIRVFWENQWRYLAPTFARAGRKDRKYHYDLDKETILPITSWKLSSGGTFSDVYMATIHPAHIVDDVPNQTPAPNAEHTFAVKKIRYPANLIDDKALGVDSLNAAWELEARNLKDMNGLNQPHIVEFITAIKKGEGHTAGYFLLFEWADNGSLRDTWTRCPRTSLSSGLVKEFVGQFLGLAQALRAIHDQCGDGANYRHGDIKPENILSFKMPTGPHIGRLKMGDWGLAKRHLSATTARDKATSTRHATPQYEAPEAETQAPLSRLYDIWAMGCVMLEFLVWLLYGHDAVLRLSSELQGPSSNRGQYYRVEMKAGRKVPRVNEVALRWMGHMARHDACASGTALGDVLQLIRDRLLVVALPARGGTLDVTNKDEPQPLGSALGLAGAAKAATDVKLASRPLLGREQPPVDIQITGPDAQGPAAKFPEPQPLFPRALASVLCRELEMILGKDSRDIDNYWSAGLSFPRRPPASYTGSNETDQLAVPDPAKRGRTEAQDQDSLGALQVAQVVVPTTVVRGRFTPRPTVLPKNNSGQELSNMPNTPQPHVPTETVDSQLDKTWTFILNDKVNGFARQVIDDINQSGSLEMPPVKQTSALCEDCQRLNFWEFAFAVRRKWSTMKANCQRCEQCRLFVKTIQREQHREMEVFEFNRVRSSLKLNEIGAPVLTLCGGPGFETRPESQVGLPVLPKSGSSAHFKILQQWLKVCNEEHPNCRVIDANAGSKASRNSSLPKRLIDVGNQGDRDVRLWETSPASTATYLALSHPWGQEPHFMTLPKNLNMHKRGIAVKRLPATFRDAIKVTRGLGLRYLWIDSICIIQGPDGDFGEQAAFMGNIFSSAYCVLAASRARRQADGFLYGRRDREYVTIGGGGSGSKPFYVCQNIDNFQDHVLGSYLNTRGWVFQERALARRTIFFTEDQTYFECGDGVQCETLAKIHNLAATLLGDPNFPKIMETAGLGERIARYQDLYKAYTALDLSDPSDRPWAIDALQTRLLNTLELKGAFGIFIDTKENPGFLRRSLLWRRSSEEPRMVKFEPSRTRPSAVPSWSWMGYTGKIDYLEVMDNHTDWKDVQLPWLDGDSLSSPGGHAGAAFITTTARDIVRPGFSDPDTTVYYDNPDEYPEGSNKRLGLQCVVLGVGMKSGRVAEVSKPHYLILVERTGQKDGDGTEAYQRAGVAQLPGRCIELKGEGTRIRIQ